MKLDASYRRTAAGEEALRSVDTAIPVDYRRILCIIDGDTHANVIRGRLRRYRDTLIDAWMAELEELGFIEAVHSSAAYDLDLQPLHLGKRNFGSRFRHGEDEARVLRGQEALGHGDVEPDRSNERCQRDK